MRILNFKKYPGTFYWGLYIDYTVEWKTKKDTMIFYRRNKATQYKVKKSVYVI